MSDEIKIKPKELTDEEAAKASAGASSTVHVSCSEFYDREFAEYHTGPAQGQCPKFEARGGFNSGVNSCGISCRHFCISRR